MDIGILISLVTIFAPLIFAAYLLISRIRLAFVNKNILNYGLIAINLTSLTCFTTQKALFLNEYNPINLNFTFFSFDKIMLDYGITINPQNITYLLFICFIYTILSLYFKFYFDKKKQFLFTKQRFYIYLSVLIFNTYMFICSPNLFQNFIFFTLEGIIIFTFSYFDIFKSSANYNITRFQRINFIGDFSLLISILILFRYAILSEGYINSPTLNFNELNILISYTYGISSSVEFELTAICFCLTFISRLFLFPLNCYNSFLANSSNIFYLTTITTNSIFGLFIFLKSTAFFDLIDNSKEYLIIYCILSAIISTILMLFEKNFKIIFGQIISIVNSIFITTFLIYEKQMLIYIYLTVNFIILFILMFLFMKDKSSLNSALIPKYKNFILERGHIFFFEKLPQKFFTIFNFIDQKIIQNLFIIPIKLINITTTLFVIKTKQKESKKYIKNILIIFALFAILAIFTTLFGRYKC